MVSAHLDKNTTPRVYRLKWGQWLLHRFQFLKLNAYVCVVGAEDETTVQRSPRSPAKHQHVRAAAQYFLTVALSLNPVKPKNGSETLWFHLKKGTAADITQTGFCWRQFCDCKITRFGMKTWNHRFVIRLPKQSTWAFSDVGVLLAGRQKCLNAFLKHSLHFHLDGYSHTDLVKIKDLMW